MATLSLHAAQRTMEEMKSIAYAAFNLSETRSDPFAVPLLGVRCKSSDLLDASLLENGEEAFYVFSFTNNAPGYVIVSADTRLPEIIAYSASDAFIRGRLPEAMTAYLERFVEKMKATPENYVAKRRTRGKFFAKSSAPSVEPLLGDIAFDQGTPYNNACPSIGGTKTQTGCVATAMSQIMKYYEYPSRMKGSDISYNTRSDNIPVTWNCSSTTFNWSKIKDTYKAYVPPYTANETVVNSKVMSLSGIEFVEYACIDLIEFANETSRTLSFKVQFILADNKGNFIRPIPEEGHVNSLESGYYYYHYWLYPTLPSNINDGNYRLYIGIQEDGTSHWSYARKYVPSNSLDEVFYLTATKTGNYFTINGSSYQYPCGYSDEEAEEVAKLHAACGATVEMDYGTDLSFAYYNDAASALINNFSFDPSLEVVYSSFFSESGLHEHIQNELMRRRPVYVGGISKVNNGHAFIIDGFRYDGSTPYYHVNWGWAGFYNAYFLIDNLEPYDSGTGGDDVNYSYDCSFYCGIEPDNHVDDGISFGCSFYKVDNSVYSAGKGMLVTIPADSELLNLSFQSFTGDIKAYACNGSISYALGKVYSASNLEPRFYLHGHNAYLNIPASIPTGTYCIVLKSQQAGSKVVREIYSPEKPVVTIKGGKLLGDVSGDNKVDDKDVKILADYILEKKTSINALKNPDVVGEGPITVSTVTAIINLIKGN
ncbi:MAG: C10 family peptidase [Bacteroidaceae bacterium]|nr:C10 family peptidase [Bacteroidaceae bacterium]